ncbi:MAG: hypothetical protein KDC98_07265 [Planctomycetes bacterium]|nr:hypothetical protein [Planctomycetota bacterium]
MARLVHALGWLIATGIPGWFAAGMAAAMWVEYRGYDERTFAAVTWSMLTASLLFGLLLARFAWRRPRMDRLALWAGGVVAALGIVTCAVLLALSGAGFGSTPGRHSGEETLVLEALLALAIAAAGIGLGMAGLAGLAARRR